MIFDIHSCLSLQQQRDQLLVPTQGSVVQRRQPFTQTQIKHENKHSHIHISVSTDYIFAELISIVQLLRPSALCEGWEGVKQAARLTWCWWRGVGVTYFH